MTKFSRGVGGLGDLDIIQTLAFVWNIYIIIVLIAGTDPPLPYPLRAKVNML